ncbi:MAG: aminodeoxychorismate/anthranilate synthase component II [Bdellovibrionaceae bacterium]|nr:aminodeoxychorismate/anthranilate synthase component II [Pseudobdellovibrionaceae bacterium]
MIYLLDSQDSFTYNIATIFQSFGAQVIVQDTRFINWATIEEQDSGIAAFILSPGPGKPEEEKIFYEILKRYAGKKPILGVCLGHQVIAQFFGARVESASQIYHGRTSKIGHDNSPLYKEIPQEFVAMRYNSLIVNPNLPNELQLSSWSLGDEQEVMGVRHKTHLIEGVQFHPESVGTPMGITLLQNFYNRLSVSTGS